MISEEQAKKFLLLRELAIRKARESFWHYCKTMAPDFYRDDREYLHKICDSLQAIYERKLTDESGKQYSKLMLNMPPRHGKSRTLELYLQWCLGRDNTNKIIQCSYSDDSAWEFSRHIRDGIDHMKNFPWETIYSDIFPETKLKYGDASVKKWALEGQFFNYIGAGIGGAITGKGCGIAVVDDPIKNAEAAFNEGELDKIWSWYTNTYLSRIEEGGIQIVLMTRWADKDLCGRLLVSEPGEWYQIRFEVQDNGLMLCDDLMSLETYENKRKIMDTSIFMANYHQRPVNIKGRLYSGFKTYDKLPVDAHGIPVSDRSFARVDTADEGEDWLCAITGDEYKGLYYVKDIYYTQDPQEITEKETADFLFRNDTREAIIESNNGGRAFARNVERILHEQKYYRCSIKWFAQTQNKETRILTNAPNVVNSIIFPADWKVRYPKFHDDLMGYLREGRNKHDDGPDVLTGIVEEIGNGHIDTGSFSAVEYNTDYKY